MKYFLSISFLLMIILKNNHFQEWSLLMFLIWVVEWKCMLKEEKHVIREQFLNTFHPAAGTLVYVLDGVSQSKSTGKWKKYSNNEYWFENQTGYMAEKLMHLI